MEYWDIYDRDRCKTGRTMIRGDKFQEGDYHLVVHVCIFNSKNEMLIQQRQPFKDGFPDKWDITVGGSAVAGDTSQSAAEREAFEELGLVIDLQSVRPHLTLNFQQGFDDFYLIEQEVEVTKLRLQPEEVKAAKWASKEEIFQMIEDGRFVPYHMQLIDLFFDMRHFYGSFRIKGV